MTKKQSLIWLLCSFISYSCTQQLYISSTQVFENVTAACMTQQYFKNYHDSIYLITSYVFILYIYICSTFASYTISLQYKHFWSLSTFKYFRQHCITTNMQQYTYIHIKDGKTSRNLLHKKTILLLLPKKVTKFWL